MRLMHLFLRSRRVDLSLLCLVGVGVVAYWLARTNFFMPIVIDGKTIPLNALFIISLAPAVVVSTSVFSPFGEIEQVASRPLASFRFVHLVGLLAWSVVTLAFSAFVWRQEYAELIVLRNLMGFTGLSLLSVPLIGSRLSWVIPFIFGMLALRIGTIEANIVAWWAWPFHPARSMIAVVLVLALLVVGTLCACFTQARDNPKEGQ